MTALQLFCLRLQHDNKRCWETQCFIGRHKHRCLFIRVLLVGTLASVLNPSNNSVRFKSDPINRLDVKHYQSVRGLKLHTVDILKDTASLPLRQILLTHHLGVDIRHTSWSWSRGLRYVYVHSSKQRSSFSLTYLLHLWPKICSFTLSELLSCTNTHTSRQK